MMFSIFCTASDSKAELQAALWKVPADFDTAASDDTSSSAQCLEKLIQLGGSEHGDFKR